VEVGRAHSFAHRCRAADIGEQQSDRDLYPSHLTFAKHGYASRAESWIAWGLPVPGVPENEATQPGERSRAQLAAGRGRDSSKRPPLAREAGTLPVSTARTRSGVNPSAVIYSIYIRRASACRL
jgi:hypothetical protein